MSFQVINDEDMNGRGVRTLPDPLKQAQLQGKHISASEFRGMRGWSAEWRPAVQDRDMSPRTGGILAVLIIIAAILAIIIC